MRGLYVLKVNRHRVFPKGDMPIRGRKDEDGRCCAGKDESEYRVCFESEDEECKHREPQCRKIQSYAGVIAHRECTFGSITCRRVRSSNSGGGQFKDPKREPEYTEQPTDHHREEVAHDPLEDCCQKKEHWSSEKENAPVGTAKIRKGCNSF